MFCPITPFTVVRCEKYIHEQGSIFPDNCFEYHQSMLSSKLNIRTQNSVLSCQMWKIPSQTGIAFMRQSFWVQTTLCYLQNWMCCPITLFQVVRFEKSLHKQGLLFCRNCLEYQQSYVIFKLNISYHISVDLNSICSIST